MNSTELRRLKSFEHAAKHKFKPSRPIISKFSAKKYRTNQRNFRKRVIAKHYEDWMQLLAINSQS